MVFQIIGGVLAAFAVLDIAQGQDGWNLAAKGLAANGYGAQSPDHFSLAAGFVAEVLLTCLFLLIIMGSTHKLAPMGAAPIAIGLTLIHLISTPITNTSVNPARSTGPVLIMGGEAFGQLWLFWLAPLLGGALGGWIYRTLISED